MRTPSDAEFKKRVFEPLLRASSSTDMRVVFLRWALLQRATAAAMFAAARLAASHCAHARRSRHAAQQHMLRRLGAGSAP
jgi:hypothetical protein